MILNLIISIFGIVNFINLDLKKCLELKVKPIQNPLFLFAIPTSFLFLIQNSTTILLSAAILFYYILNKDENFVSQKIICLKKTCFIVVTLSILSEVLILLIMFCLEKQSLNIIKVRKKRKYLDIYFIRNKY